jgi:hypothetical protein
MNNLTHTLKSFLSECLALVQSKNSLDTTKSKIITVSTLGVWLAIVIFITTRHEFWRDEVRALSLARAAIFPTDLYGLIQYEGHPVLWYLLLYIGKTIVDIPLILPIISIAIAFAAMAIFMFFAPFPFWFRCLFIFCGLPLYEYSVMARNYGISVLLMFVAAVLYRNRYKYPLWLAFTLALLANTNLPSTILVCLITAIWAWDVIIQPKKESVRVQMSSLFLALIIIFAGVLLCLAFAWPRENTILVSVNDFSLQDFVEIFQAVVSQPGESFSTIVPKVASPIVASLLLYLAIFGLLFRVPLILAALGAMTSLGVFYSAINLGAYRNQGLFLVFLIFLYWISIEVADDKKITRTKQLLFNAGLYIAMFVLILGNIAVGKTIIIDDITMERSSNEAFGEFLSSSLTYQDAIIVPEPDYLLESLPYYAPNLMYLPREQRFGTTVSWTTEAKAHLSLGELLSTAHTLKTRSDQPVLIVIGHMDFGTDESGKQKFSYNKVFAWNEEEFAEFEETATLVAVFDAAYGDENYRVYEIR